MHIAIIPDGNRRWAKKQALHPWKGHERAVENFRSSLEWCYNDPRVDTLTIWCFSTENWKRDAKEVSMLMKLFVRYMQEERQKFHEKNIRVRHSGRKDRLPEEVVALLTALEEETAEYTACNFHLAMDYGGKDEIIRAAEKCRMQNAENHMSDALIREHLDQPDLPDIDLIIRTSGEQRTSNFFLWQSTYAEWMFLSTLFPDFSEEHLAQCVDTFGERQRRFGG